MTLINANSPDNDNSLTILPEDHGHRLGNFHNYYNFHPSRVDMIEPLLDYIVLATAATETAAAATTATTTPFHTFHYCDLGCNEGDFTIDIARALQSGLRPERAIQFQGIDIDDKLIERANNKWHNTPSISGTFTVGNICHFEQLLSFDLISLFSTTMWIHIHTGDKGLEQLLQAMCCSTKRFLLIEPQPSKCYRMAVVRLRKLGRPEVDISKLAWRPNLEEHLQQTMESCGFHRVLPSVATTTNQRTVWNRKMHLYERNHML